MKPSKRQKLEQHCESSAVNTKTCVYHTVKEITFNHAKNYLEMLNQLTAANFYVTNKGEAIFNSHDTLSTIDLDIDKYFPLLINRVSRFCDKINIPYIVENFINTQVSILYINDIHKYQQKIEESYMQPLNWYDENEIKHIIETEIMNSREECFFQFNGMAVPLFGKEDGKYFEPSRSPMYVYDERKTDPISLYHFARINCKSRV